MKAKDVVLRAHLQGRLHTLDMLESISEHYEDLDGPDAIRRAVKLIREAVIKQAALEGIKS